MFWMSLCFRLSTISLGRAHPLQRPPRRRWHSGDSACVCSAVPPANSLERNAKQYPSGDVSSERHTASFGCHYAASSARAWGAMWAPRTPSLALQHKNRRRCRGRHRCSLRGPRGTPGAPRPVPEAFAIAATRGGFAVSRPRATVTCACAVASASFAMGRKHICPNCSWSCTVHGRLLRTSHNMHVHSHCKLAKSTSCRKDHCRCPALRWEPLSEDNLSW
mmetsp:Transcript_64168/g.106096  ORF Transcript_64168/g.106096 Transcript_64168/m.106096 type:complete len:220 (-) Transcript_64168:463-1122(-)